MASSGPIRLGEPAVEVEIRRSARARRMVLRVGGSGRPVTLTMPLGVPVAHARAFLSEHEGWLRQQLARRPARRPVEEGSTLPFGDGALTLRTHDERRTGRADPDLLLLPRAGAPLGLRAAAWLREEARREAAAGIERHAARLGLRAGRLSLRDPRGRWGSCTSAGDLMISWRLAMAPTAVLDYVVAHEVAHLAEMNHSPRFWAVVKRLVPDYEAPRGWLRRHGAELHLYDFAAA